jgi:hypothetical protein
MSSPANIRLGWKSLPSTNTLAYSTCASATKKKMFYDVDFRWNQDNLRMQTLQVIKRAQQC